VLRLQDLIPAENIPDEYSTSRTFPLKDFASVFSLSLKEYLSTPEELKKELGWTGRQNNH
jgi:hypothetical protein